MPLGLRRLRLIETECGRGVRVLFEDSRAILVMTSLRSLCSSTAYWWALSAASLFVRACASRRLIGFSASLMAGDFIAPGGPITRPQRFGTSHQSVFRCGRIAIFRPRTAPSATIAGIATKSSGHCIRSAMSSTQGAMLRGRKAGSKRGTGESPAGNGFRFAQALALVLSSVDGAAFASRGRLIPSSTARRNFDARSPHGFSIGGHKVGCRGERRNGGLAVERAGPDKPADRVAFAIERRFLLAVGRPPQSRMPRRGGPLERRSSRLGTGEPGRGDSFGGRRYPGGRVRKRRGERPHPSAPIGGGGQDNEAAGRLEIDSPAVEARAVARTPRRRPHRGCGARR